MAGFGLFSRRGLSDYAVTEIVNMFGGDLTRRYGQKVHKLTCTAVLAALTVTVPSGVVAALL